MGFIKDAFDRMSERIEANEEKEKIREANRKKFRDAAKRLGSEELAQEQLEADWRAEALYKMSIETDIAKKIKMQQRINHHLYDFSDL